MERCSAGTGTRPSSATVSESARGRLCALRRLRWRLLCGDRSPQKRMRWPAHPEKLHHPGLPVNNTCTPSVGSPEGHIVMAPRCTTSATGPSRPRYTAWCSNTPRPSSPRPKRPSALACASSSDEFDTFLECGILAHGFVRQHCADCGHDKRSNDLVSYVTYYLFGSRPRCVFGGSATMAKGSSPR